jgi:predicted phage terminase large subunit-like protein
MIEVEPEGDKVSRAWAVTPPCEAGNVWLPHPKIAPWVKTFMAELTQFPYAANDDFVDSFSQLLRRFMKRLEAEKFAAQKTSSGYSHQSYGA